MTSPITDFPQSFTGNVTVRLTGGASELELTSEEGQLWFGSEQHEISVTKTQYPVETGVNLVDHAVREPARLTLTGIVSSVSLRPRQNYRIVEVPDNPVTGSTIREPVFYNPLGIKAAGEMWQKIAKFMSENSVFTVDTLYGRYENMLIVKADGTSDSSTGTSMRFTLDMEEILYAYQISNVGDFAVREPDDLFPWGTEPAVYSTLPKGWEGASHPLLQDAFDPEDFRGNYYRIPLGGPFGGNPHQWIDVVFAGFGNADSRAVINTTVKVSWIDVDLVQGNDTIIPGGYWTMDTPFYPNGAPPLDAPRADGTVPVTLPYVAGVPMRVARWPLKEGDRVIEEPLAWFEGGAMIVLPEDPFSSAEMGRFGLGNTHHLYLMDRQTGLDLKEHFEARIEAARNLPPPGTRKEIGYFFVRDYPIKEVTLSTGNKRRTDGILEMPGFVELKGGEILIPRGGVAGFFSGGTRSIQFGPYGGVYGLIANDPFERFSGERKVNGAVFYHVYIHNVTQSLYDITAQIDLVGAVDSETIKNDLENQGIESIPDLWRMTAREVPGPERVTGEDVHAGALYYNIGVVELDENDYNPRLNDTFRYAAGDTKPTTYPGTNDE